MDTSNTRATLTEQKKTKDIQLSRGFERKNEPAKNARQPNAAGASKGGRPTNHKKGKCRMVNNERECRPRG